MYVNIVSMDLNIAYMWIHIVSMWIHIVHLFTHAVQYSANMDTICTLMNAVLKQNGSKGEEIELIPFHLNTMQEDCVSKWEERCSMYV